MSLDTEQLDQEAEAFVRKLGIPPCPAIITRLIREARSDDPDFNRIAALISSDVSLSAAMLSTVNSAYYGLRKKAETVHRALVFLGLQTCTHLVTRLMLRSAFPVSNSPAMKRFWAAAARASLMAGLVARHTRSVDPELASTFALFRDAGIPVLLAQVPEYAPLLTPENLHGGAALLELEANLCAIDHARVGLLLARNWDLHEEMSTAILRHHDYALSGSASEEDSELSRRLVAVGLIADGIGTQITATPNAEWEQSRDFALDLLAVTEDDLDELIDAARAVIASA